MAVTCEECTFSFLPGCESLTLVVHVVHLFCRKFNSIISIYNSLLVLPLHFVPCDHDNNILPYLKPQGQTLYLACYWNGGTVKYLNFPGTIFRQSEIIAVSARTEFYKNGKLTINISVKFTISQQLDFANLTCSSAYPHYVNFYYSRILCRTQIVKSP